MEAAQPSTQSTLGFTETRESPGSCASSCPVTGGSARSECGGAFQGLEERYLLNPEIKFLSGEPPTM